MSSQLLDLSRSHLFLYLSNVSFWSKDESEVKCEYDCRRIESAEEYMFDTNPESSFKIRCHTDLIELSNHIARPQNCSVAIFPCQP